MPGVANIPQRGFLSKYFVTIIFPILAGTAITQIGPELRNSRKVNSRKLQPRNNNKGEKSDLNRNQQELK